MRQLTVLFAALLTGLVLQAQNTIAFQGFEGGASCPDWGYTGGEVNTMLAKTGIRSNRVGRDGGSTTITMDPVNVSAYANVQLSVSHAVLCGSGPGLDWSSTGGFEGAVIEVNYNGSGWTTVGRMNGGGDYCYTWSSPGGAGGGCGHTMPNPLLVNVPAGTTTVQVRAYSTNSSNCAVNTPGNYSRGDENFYVDDIRLTTTSAVTTPATGSVTWTGLQSTDWFDCRNWNPTVVPGPGWDVTINQSGSNHCVIGVTTGTPTLAACASLTMTSSGTQRRLTINNGRTLNVLGPTVVQRSSATADSLVFLVQSGHYSTTGLSVSGSGAAFRNHLAANNVLVSGPLNITTNGLVHVGNSILQVGGDVNNLVSASALRRSSTTWVVLNGNTDQHLITSGFTDTYPQLRVQKPGGDVYIDAVVEIGTGGTLDLLQGRLFTPGSTMAIPRLVVKPSATVTNASNSSFVHGIMRKQGNTPFRFPVGKGHVMRPIALIGAFGSSNTVINHYTAEYIDADPQLTFGTAINAPLDHISQCEYWDLRRTGGATTATVQLTWSDPTSCGVDQPLTLSVVRWDPIGSAWMDRGNSDVIITGPSGSVDSQNAENTFGYWTLGSVSNFNPLPIELLEFRARPNQAEVDLHWSTASERNNAYFTVERSDDAVHFSPVLQLEGRGDSQSRTDYEAVDPAPLPGWSYYRLRQTDHDGSSTWSSMVPVHFRSTGTLQIASTAEGITVRHTLGQGRFEVLDMEGRRIAEGSSTSDVLHIPMQAQARGVYLLRMTGSTRDEHVRFVH